LATLLQHARVLTLKNLTTGQMDSLLQQIEYWARLERLTIDNTYAGPGRPNPHRLVTLPPALSRFKKLGDIRIQEEGLDWAQSLPVLEHMKALRRLEINRWSGQSDKNQPPVLSTLRQLTALHLSNGGWQITPETVGALPRLAELTLSSLHIETGTLAEVLNQLPRLKTLGLRKCWRVTTLSLNKLSQLKTVTLAYNDKLSVDSTVLAGMIHVERLTIKGGQPISLNRLVYLPHLCYLNVMGNQQFVYLPKSLGGRLNKLTDLRLCNVRLGSLPVDFGGLSRLQTLHLNYCNLDSLPTTVNQLKALRDLSLQYNKLRQLPSGIDKLKNLCQLNVSGNQLTVLPNGIGRLHKLTQLNASSNQLTQLPNSITQLMKLKHLIADHNQLDRLPGEIGEVKGLTELSVQLNHLTQLPSSLLQLSRLRSISADYNQLERLPEDIEKLRRLRFLSLKNNQLTFLPEQLGQLDSLQYLWIEQNRLKELPDGIGQLHSLRELRIDSNELKVLPATIGSLSQLTVLSINKALITELPPSIGKLAKLQMLSIMDTPLRSLPGSVDGLVDLQFVRLSNNQLTTLPEAIRQWRSVTTLDLTGNPLEQLPNGIGGMASLSELTIKGKSGTTVEGTNSLRKLPDSLIYCDQLQILTIENQPQLDANDVFTKAAQLKNLTELSVVNCQINRLPDLAWKELPWQKLNVASNRLTDLPFGLVDVPELRYISAQKNRLPDALNRDFIDKQALLSSFTEAGMLPQAMTKGPNSTLTEALLRTANEKGASGDWTGAVAALTKAITIAPDSMLALPYGERSSMYLARKQYVDALADLDSAINYAPRLHYRGISKTSMILANWKWKGYIFAKMGQYDKALVSLGEAERLIPADSIMKYAQSVGSNEVERGRYLFLQGKRSLADSSYRKAIKAYDKSLRLHVGIQLLVVDLCLVTGQYDRAQRILADIQPQERQKEYNTIKEYLSACLVVLQGKKTGRQAVEVLQAYRASHPDKIYWRLNLTEQWLKGSAVSADRIAAIQQIREAARDWLIQPD
jgi:Leucine-rich repeat (LRR) protein